MSVSLKDTERVWLEQLLDAALMSTDVPNGAEFARYLEKTTNKYIEKFSDVEHSTDEDDTLVRISRISISTRLR